MRCRERGDFGVATGSATPSGDWIALSVAPDFVPENVEATPEEFTYAVLEFVTSGGGSVADGPHESTIGGVPAATATVEGIPGKRTGALYDGTVAILFGETATYFLVAQYSPDNMDEVLAAWADLLDSFEP